MSEHDTFTLKPREVLPTLSNLREDELDIISSPADAVALVSGMLANGIKGNWLAVGRLGQAAFKGELSNQFMRELKNLKDQGKIPDDFMNKPRSFETWTDIMSAIDNGETDAEKLGAVKSMFYAMNTVNATDSEKILAYQLFQIAKKLTSGELFLLRTVYRVRDKLTHQINPVDGHNFRWLDWLGAVAKAQGHDVTSIIEHHETALVANKLIGERGNQGNTVPRSDGRLTNLGIIFCRNIETYERETKASEE